MEILDAKYDKANLPAIVRDSCSHLDASQREKLLSLLLKIESLFDGRKGLSHIMAGHTPYHKYTKPL
jgi:hypothetical protein